MTEVLAHRGRALTPEETEELLRDRLGDHVQRAVVEYGVFTLWLAPEGWLEAARRCREERLLAYDMFDSLFGIDARDDGFDVVAVLYSTSTGNRIALRARCDGGRESPSLPSIAEVYRGADWMEREAYDMFGIDFPGHPGLEPRLLTVENFEGWPLRKDFHLASRVAKPWPGVAEPVELDEEGNKIERERTIGDAPGPYELDKALAEQAKVVNAPPAPVVESEASPAEASAASPAEAAGEVEEGPEGSAAAPGPTEEDRTASDGEQDPAARAKAKAEERRRRQAEARAAKARARAEQAQQADGAPGAGAPESASPPAGDSSVPTPAAVADQPAADQAAADQPAAEASDEEDADVDPRVAARRQRQAEARAARAKARADKAGGAAAPSGDEAVAEQAVAEQPQDDQPEDDQPEQDQPAADQPADDPATTAKAKAEARRKRQAEARAARAKARAEQAEADVEGDA